MVRDFQGMDVSGSLLFDNIQSRRLDFSVCYSSEFEMNLLSVKIPGPKI